MRWQWRVLLAALIAAVAIGGIYAVVLQRQVTARLDAAAARAAAAERDAATATAAATHQIEATRLEAERQIAEARQTALQAQIMTNVLAAPDLVRLNLAGIADTASAGASAQVLWSRSRGLVVSASRLAPAPAGLTYQVWMVGESGSVSAGLLTTDAEGRATIVGTNPQDLPRRVTGVIVTLEPAGGAATPSGTTVLARPQVVTPQ